MSEIFTHRCAARGDDGRENCHATNEWELVGGNACSRCGHVPDATWRRNMGAKMGLNVDALDAPPPVEETPKRRNSPRRTAATADTEETAETEAQSEAETEGEEKRTEEAETATPPTRGTGRRGRGQ